MKTIALVVALVGMSLGVIGNFFNWYRQITWYDEVIHFTSTFGLTLLIASFVRAGVPRALRQHALWSVFLIAGGGVLLGVLWEVAEWLYDESVNPNVIKGKTDTIIDLVVDFFGAFTAGVVAWAVHTHGYASRSASTGPPSAQPVSR